MQSQWKMRVPAALALGAVAAGWLLFDSFDSRAAMTAVAEPVPTQIKNTGSEAGDAFLMDLSKAVDPGSRYLAEYEMDQEWIKIAYRERNVRFDQNGMTLTLAKNAGRPPFSGAEFQRNGTYGYGRYEVVLKASDGWGAVTSFFTYTGEYFGDPHDEIDFEFLGRQTRSVYVNYFSHGEKDQAEIPLWFDASQGDHLYAFEWAPESIRWYIDGVKVREVDTTSARVKVPTSSGRVMASIWAASGSAEGWVGEAAFKRTTASYRCISHVPAGRSGSQCSDTFKPRAGS